MTQPPQLADLTPPGKKKNLFDGLSAWQKILTVLPLVLLVGGAIGGLTGAAGACVNAWIARTALPTPAKVAAMLGITLAALACYWVMATQMFGQMND